MVELATLEELEAFVADLGPDGAADVFLAYRLGDELRRETWPASPGEPCALPLIAVEERGRPAREPSSYRIGEWTPTWAPDDYAAAVREVRAATSTR